MSGFSITMTDLFVGSAEMWRLYGTFYILHTIAAMCDNNVMQLVCAIEEIISRRLAHMHKEAPPDANAGFVFL